MGEYLFNVKMSCAGCSGAVSRALSKVEGITYDVNLEKQQVKVTGDVPYDEVLDKIKKTGKEVVSSEVVSSEVVSSEVVSSEVVTA